ncbi:cytochrome P450 [Sorangium sp. So ce281]|uniref:cytochrome P450 n=1 Tax=unclassified Sorangium TaxID=2621164 RepID=UPI003F60DFEA
MRRISRPCAQREDHPVAPGGVPVLGHLPLLYLDATGLFRRSQATVGPVFWVDLGFGRERLFCMGLESLELLRSPSVSNDGAYSDLDEMAGRSLLTTDGAPHRHMRAALSPSLSLHGLSISELTVPLASLIEARIDRWLSRGSVDVLPQMKDLTLEIILRISGAPVDRLQDWKVAYRDFALGLFPVPGHLPGLPRYRSARARMWLDAELARLIARARHGHAEGGVLSGLVNARDESGEPLSTDELVDNLRAMLLAGHETSASVLAWMLFLLARRPALWDALVDEYEAQPDSSLPASPKELRSFPVAEAIFRETLRMHAPVWFILRTAVNDVVSSGRHIKAGTPLAISPAALGRDPNVFSDPDRFDLGRWMGRAKAPTPLELSPFGGGSHFCLGYGLALFEAVCLLVALARGCKKRGLRPAHRGAEPRPLYFPLAHPWSTSHVQFERA